MMIQAHRGALGLLIPISLFLAGCSSTNFSLIEYEDESLQHSPQQMVMTAYMLEQRGDYSQAADLYTRALIQDPSQDVARKRLFALRNQGTQNPFEGNLTARRNAIQEAHNQQEPKLAQFFQNAYTFEENDQYQVQQNYVQQTQFTPQPKPRPTTPVMQPREMKPQEVKQQLKPINQPKPNQVAITKSQLQKLQSTTNKPIIILTEKQYIQIKKVREMAQQKAKKESKSDSNTTEHSTRDILSGPKTNTSTSQTDTKQSVGFFLAAKKHSPVRQVSATGEDHSPLKQADQSIFKARMENPAGKVFLNDLEELSEVNSKPVLKKIEKNTKTTPEVQTIKTSPVKKKSPVVSQQPTVIHEPAATQRPEVILTKPQPKLATVLPKHAYPNEIEPIPVTPEPEETTLPKTPSLEELALLLRDKSIHKKVEAAIMLSMETSDLSYRMEILKHCLKSEKDQLVRINIAGAMLKLSPDSQEAKDVLAEGINTEKANDKICSITLVNATETTESDKSVETLVEALNDNDPHVRAISALNLAHADKNQDLAIAGLSRALNDENVDVRIAADAALACLIESVKKDKVKQTNQSD